jgi:hypothetical protein
MSELDELKAKKEDYTGKNCRTARSHRVSAGDGSSNKQSFPQAVRSVPG